MNGARSLSVTHPTITQTSTCVNTILNSVPVPALYDVQLPSQIHRINRQKNYVQNAEYPRRG